MQEQQQQQPINIEEAEFILSLVSQKNNAFKSMLHLLRRIEAQLEARKKQNTQFYQVVQAVDEHYRHKLYADQQLIQRLHSEIVYINQDMDGLANRRTSLKQELETHERELESIREYAEERRNKKSKRERQYHQLYHVPLVAAQYKKKYVRARDKNSDAEEKVSEVRATVDACQRAIGELSKSLTDSQKRGEQLALNQRDVEAQTKEVQALVTEMQEGCRFWYGFDEHQLLNAQRATTQFIEHIQRSARNGSVPPGAVQANLDVVKMFKMALYEYGKAEHYADGRWGQLQVEFNCARCRTSQLGWPKPDKVRPNDLLCQPCYKEYHTSMLWEKKMSGVSQQLQNLPGGSMLSFSSQSTVATTESGNSQQKKEKTKPGFKKMIQMLKKNKRQSSSNSSLSVDTTQQRMMMA